MKKSREGSLMESLEESFTEPQEKFLKKSREKSSRDSPEEYLMIGVPEEIPAKVNDGRSQGIQQFP